VAGLVVEQNLSAKVPQEELEVVVAVVAVAQ